jgi:GNAT superfamily N-acetyltransferase
MRTEIIDQNRVQSYYDCIPEPLIMSINKGRLKAVGGLFTDEKKGAVVWQEMNERDAILRSLYVLPEARRLGLGSLLLKPLKGKQLTFSYEATEERASLEPFFDNNNIFYERHDYPVGRITISKAVEALKKKGVDQAHPIGSYYDELLKNEKTEVLHWLENLCKESQTDYTSLNPASIFYLEQGKVKGALLFSKAEKGNLGVDYVFCAHGEEGRLAGMMNKAMTLLSRQFRVGTEVTMMMTTERGKRLYRTLFGEPADTIPVISGTLDGDQVWDDDF